MALEAIARVEQAEADAVRLKTEAAQKARRLAVIAEGEGEQALEAARQRAAARLQELDRQAEERIRAEADRIRAETESELSVLRARAENRLDQAAEIIAERFVSG